MLLHNINVRSETAAAHIKLTDQPQKPQQQQLINYSFGTLEPAICSVIVHVIFIYIQEVDRRMNFKVAFSHASSTLSFESSCCHHLHIDDVGVFF